MSDSLNTQFLKPGSMIQEYKIEKVLGAGNFGIVYKASNIYLDEVVAIKEFLPAELSYRSDNSNVVPLSPDFKESYTWALERFLKEAKILWNLGKPAPHRNIVEVKRFHKDHGTAYMVMAYEEGEPFLTFLKNHGPLSPNQLESILLQLLDGLEKVHACSVLHRDIKPSNILIRPDGSPVLIDFGAARRDFINPDKSILAVYSPMYAALEQVAQTGEQGPWTDIYGIGATFYHVITGKAPTSPLARINGATHTPAVDWVDKHYQLSFLTAIDTAIELKSNDRPQSIAEFRKLLSTTEIISSNDKTIIIPPEQPKKKPKASKLLVILPTTFIVLIGLTLLFWSKFWNTLPSDNSPVSDDRSLPLNSATLLTKIKEITNKIDCSSLKVKLSEDFNLQISGHVGSELELNKLSNDLASLGSIRQLETNILIYERPFCSAANILKQYGQESIVTRDGIEITFNNTKREYQIDDFLVINARASKLFDGYLYIDYLDSSDHVVTHLFPSPVKPNNLVKANEKVKIGINREISLFENERSYKLMHSGKNLVIVIYSKDILFEKIRPEEELIEDYLLDLQTILKKVPDSYNLLFKLTPLTIY